MKVLAIDTSGPVCGVAVAEDQRILCEMTVMNKRTHSANLMPMIENVLQNAGTTLDGIDRIAAVTGPGSFTGIRIGISTVKGLAHGAHKPCVDVDALEALAFGAGAFDGVVCPIQDARAGQVYGAAFRDGERLMEDTAIRLEDYVDAIQAFGERFLFVGDGMEVHRERLTELLGEKALFAPGHLCFLRPSAVALLGIKEKTELDYLALMPYYLRPPNAEKNKKLMEAMAHE